MNALAAAVKHMPLPATPRLSARSAAMFLKMPAYKQAQLLREQKYPKQAPQVFKQPYYQAALTAIRELVLRGSEGIAAARSLVQRIAPATQRMHNMRVLEQFASSDFTQRTVTLMPIPRLYATIGDLQLRMSADLHVVEGEQQKYIFFNCRAERQDPEVARFALEIAHWILEKNGIKLKLNQLEFVDLFTLERHVYSRRRTSTIRMLEGNARIIESLWPGIDP